MSKKVRLTDKDGLSLSKNANRTQNKSTKDHHGFTEKSRKMVTIMFIIPIGYLLVLLPNLLVRYYLTSLPLTHRKEINKNY